MMGADYNPRFWLVKAVEKILDVWLEEFSDGVMVGSGNLIDFSGHSLRVSSDLSLTGTKIFHI